MIDPELVIRKINLISEDLQALKRFSGMSLEQYLQDPLNEPLAERYLERIIGRMIDINYHVVTELGHAPPRDYFQSFLELGKLGILPAEFSRSIARVAGLRNRLVHEYDLLDETKIFDALEKAREDIPRYLKHLFQYIQDREA